VPDRNGVEEAIVVTGAFVVVVVALVVVVVIIVGTGLGAGVASVAGGAGAVETGADEPGDDAGELRAVGVLPLHPLNTNSGSETETAVSSQ
jgi:hypothetical protein